MTEDRAMDHRIVRLPSFHVVGLQGSFTPRTTSEIPALWSAFVPRIPAIPRRRGTATFGLCRPSADGPGAPPRFEYTAGVEVDALAAPPAGLATVTVPASTYAVFTHDGPVSGIGRTFDAIHGAGAGGGALAAAGLEPAPGYEFERYDERWDARTASGPVDIYVPVSPPTR
jgi:AraC family transcriptional regulator